MSAHFHPRLTYAIAPPNQATAPERRREIAAAHSARIASLPVDALLVYDVQDETARNDKPRPFRFMPKVDALEFALDQLDVGSLPLVVYRVVAAQTESTMCSWLDRLATREGRAILVGAPSPDSPTSLTLSDAHALSRRHTPSVDIGGIVIPERHIELGAEDERVFSKVNAGCSFFVSQTLWSVETSKQFLRALSHRAEAEKRAAPHILFTLSPCGSVQTLDFLEWLGIQVPQETKKDLLAAENMLARSVDLCLDAYREVRAFALAHGLSVGCNVESVSARIEEVEASVELVRRIHQLDAESDERLGTAPRVTGGPNGAPRGRDARFVQGSLAE